MLDQILILVVLILFSGFFSSAELAFFSISSLRIRHMADSGVKGAEAVRYLKDRSRHLLNTILIGNNLVNIGASVYATTVALDIFQSNVIGIVTGVMTFFILVFGEIIPKSFAITHGEKIAILYARPFKLLVWICYPLVKMLDFFNWLFHIETIKKKPLITEDEIKSYVSAGEEIGQISENEKDLINRVFRFDNINVDEIMTPRTEMVILREDRKIKNIVKTILESGFSRYPVYEHHRDKIVGIIHAWDVLKSISQGKEEIKVNKLMMKPHFVPESIKVDEMLKSFLRRKHHLAIVVDEYGGTAGLVSLEDVLEEMVGEIIDERDKVEPEIVKVNGKAWNVLGRTDVDDFFDKFQITRKKGDFDTVNGFLLDKLGRIPEEKEKIKFRKYDIIVQEMSGNRIKELKVIKK